MQTTSRPALTDLKEKATFKILNEKKQGRLDSFFMSRITNTTSAAIDIQSKPLHSDSAQILPTKTISSIKIIT